MLLLILTALLVTSTEAALPSHDPPHPLVRWLTEQHAGTVRGIKISTGGRRGVITTQALNRSVVVLRVPLSLVISVEHAVQSELNAQEALDSLGDTDALALFLLFELSRRQHSYWAPYLSFLPPTTAIPGALGFDNATISFFEDFPHFTQEAHRLQHTVQSRYHQIVRAGICDNNRCNLTIIRLNWAVAMVQSRLFAIQVRDSQGTWQKAHGLVPFADLFNNAASEELNAHCATNDASTHFECFTTKALHSHSELFLPYAAKNNYDLLLNYGFTVPSREVDDQKLHKQYLLLQSPAVIRRRRHGHVSRHVDL